MIYLGDSSIVYGVKLVIKFKFFFLYFKWVLLFNFLDSLNFLILFTTNFGQMTFSKLTITYMRSGLCIQLPFLLLLFIKIVFKKYKGGIIQLFFTVFHGLNNWCLSICMDRTPNRWEFKLYLIFVFV